MKRLNEEVASDQGKVVGRALDRIRDFHVRTLAMADCLSAIERWDVAEKPTPAKTIHDDLAKVIDLEQRRAELAPRGEP